jgi:hypothetical protein
MPPALMVLAYIFRTLKTIWHLAPPDVHFHLYRKTFSRTDSAHQLYPALYPFSSRWMQTRFALAMFLSRPENIFPVQAVGFSPKKYVTITVHDLAFKNTLETSRGLLVQT